MGVVSYFLLKCHVPYMLLALFSGADYLFSEYYQKYSLNTVEFSFKAVKSVFDLWLYVN